MAVARTARATVIVYDSFSQSAGNNLGGTTPTTPNPNTSGVNQQWNAQSGPADNTFVSPGLTFSAAGYSNGPPVSGNAVGFSGTLTNADRVVVNSSGSSFSATGDLTTAYYSMLLYVPSDITGIESNSNQNQSNNNAFDGYNQSLLAAFSDSSGLTGGLGTQITGVYLSAGSTPGTVDIGIGGNRNGVVWSSDLQAGETYFLVGSFVESSSAASSLWIDPALGLSSPPATSLVSDSGENGGFGDNSVSTFVLTSNPGLPNSGLDVDEVRVGTSWQDVTPAVVPEPSTLALLGIGLIGMVVGSRRGRCSAS